jgi:hypothetical protein
MRLSLFPPEKVGDGSEIPPDLAGAVALMRNRAKVVTPFTAKTNDPGPRTFGYQSPEIPGLVLLPEGFRGPRGPTVGAKPKPRPGGLGNQNRAASKSHIACTHLFDPFA